MLESIMSFLFGRTAILPALFLAVGIEAEFGLLPDGLTAVKFDAANKEKDKKQVSLLHPEYITDVSFAGNDGRVDGIVEFRAGNAYRGKARFVARRLDGEWQIVQFILPAREPVLSPS